MTNEDKLHEVDTFVAMCEDFMHGKDGDDATKCRRLLAEVIKDLIKLHQTTVIGVVCECKLTHTYCDCIENNMCEECGKPLKAN